ncbi:MAG: hypothetical protein NZ528_15795 [Caldilineales bacterium]|nr:hypothetical protein [Caldilineales bacterium]
MQSKSVRNPILAGILLVVVGLLFLLWNFGVFSANAQTMALVAAGLFAVAGLGYLVAYMVFRRQSWWLVIPGFTLLAVGGLVYLYWRQVPFVWMGVVLFVALALAFAVIYFTNRRERWWGLIPFGALLVLVAMVVLNDAGVTPPFLGAVMFGGLSLTFALIYLLTPERSTGHWPLVPTAVLAAMALVSLASGLRQRYPTMEALVNLWPLLVIGLGVALFVVAITRSGKEPAPVALPAEPAPAEVAPAPGAEVHAMAEPAPQPARFARAPITLVEPAAPVAPKPPQPETSADEPADIYQLLESAPPSGDEPAPKEQT